MSCRCLIRHVDALIGTSAGGAAVRHAGGRPLFPCRGATAEHQAGTRVTELRSSSCTIRYTR